MYRNNVKAWLRDAAFFAELSQYVRFFSQEVYGRLDRWAVPGTTPDDRVGPTSDYLEHFAYLAAAGGYETGDTASFVAAADAPVANAAWSNSGAYEWPSPAVDYLLAANYEAGQVQAFRHDQDGRAEQSFGFAWAPTNPGLTTSDFNNKTAFILDRMASAIHDSDTPDGSAGLAACGPDLSWCAGDYAGAAFNSAWSVFHDWTQPAAEPSTIVVQQDETTAVPLTASDPDPGQTLTYSIVAQPQHGSVTTEGSASATYTPEPGYHGPDSFTFRAYDGWLNSAPATVTIDVNAPPAVDAGADLASVWGEPVAFAGTATDPDDTALDATWSFGDGTSAAGLDVSHAYTDPGTYTATLTVSDGRGGVGSDTTTVVVGPRASTLTGLTPVTLDVASAKVSGQLADLVPGSRLEGHTVTFAAGAATCTATTDAAGSVGCTLDGLTLGPSAVTATFDGDRLYSASAEKTSTIVYAEPTDGVFAVGDRSATGAVTFWSGSWWKSNLLGGGTAPASFKGFLHRDGTTAPGLANVPATVPAWMGVAVIDRVAKEGSAITAHITRFVVVHVETYDPAVAGIGTVAADID